MSPLDYHALFHSLIVSFAAIGVIFILGVIIFYALKGARIDKRE